VTAKTSSFTKKFRNAFLTGLLIFLPLGTTIFVLNFLLGLFQGPVTIFVEQLGVKEENFFFGMETLLAIVGLLLGVLALTLLGFLSNYFLGKVFIGLTEKFLGKVPFLNSVYRSAKQIVDTFGKENRAVFQEVVMIEYPRSNCYVLGFVTTEASGETVEAIGKNLTNVFVPTTPNPTSGFLLLLPRKDIFPLEMSVGEGMKMLISGGAVIPSSKAKQIKSRTTGNSSRKAKNPGGKEVKASGRKPRTSKGKSTGGSKPKTGSA
jgi:uncharacterized membrane protein